MFFVKEGTWYVVPGKATSAEFANPSKNILDLVRMSVLAHRHGAGNIVWGCWQPGGAGTKIKHPRSINSGAMLLMMNPAGAGYVLSKMVDLTSHGGPAPIMKPGHFDIELNKLLWSARRAQEAKACYIIPPIGNYSTHPSGCDPKFGKGEGRPSCWDESWCCPGTRRSEDPQYREKMFVQWSNTFVPKNLGSASVEEHGEELDWKSFWQGGPEPPQYRSAEERRPQKRPAASSAALAESSARGGSSRVEPTATRPPLLTTTRGVQAERRQRADTALAEGAAAWRGRGGANEPANIVDPISEMLEEVQHTYPEADTKRRRRNQRTALLNRSFRSWVPTREEVDSIPSNKKKYGCVQGHARVWVLVCVGHAQHTSALACGWMHNGLPAT